MQLCHHLSLSQVSCLLQQSKVTCCRPFAGFIPQIRGTVQTVCNFCLCLPHTFTLIFKTLAPTWCYDWLNSCSNLPEYTVETTAMKPEWHVLCWFARHLALFGIDGWSPFALQQTIKYLSSDHYIITSFWPYSFKCHLKSHLTAQLITTNILCPATWRLPTPLIHDLWLYAHYKFYYHYYYYYMYLEDNREYEQFIHIQLNQQLSVLVYT